MSYTKEQYDRCTCTIGSHSEQCSNCAEYEYTRNEWQKSRIAELEAELEQSGNTSVARVNALIQAESRVKELEAERDFARNKASELHTKLTKLELDSKAIVKELEGELERRERYIRACPFIARLQKQMILDAFREQPIAVVSKQTEE